MEQLELAPGKNETTISIANGLALVAFAGDFLLNLPDMGITWNNFAVALAWAAIIWGLTYAAGIAVTAIIYDLPFPWVKDEEEEEPVGTVHQELLRQTVVSLETPVSHWQQRNVVDGMLRVGRSTLVLPEGITPAHLEAIAQARADGSVDGLSKRVIANVTGLSRQGESSPANDLLSFLIEHKLLDETQKNQQFRFTQVGRRIFPSPTDTE